MQIEPRNRKKLAPARLPEKLLLIRQSLGISQAEMLLIVNPIEESGSNRARVSQYETRKRVPSLVEVQNYADAVNIDVEILTDDRLDLPLSVRRKAKLYRDKQRKKSASGQASGNIGRNGGKGAKKRHGAVYYTADLPASATAETKANRQPENDSQPESASRSATAESFQIASQRDDALQEIKNDNTGGSNQEIAPAAESIIPPVPDTSSASSAAPINSTLWTEESERICKPMYLNQLGDLPLGKMSRLPIGKFVELMTRVIADDFRAHGTESAIARRVRLYIEFSD